MKGRGKRHSRRESRKPKSAVRKAKRQPHPLFGEIPMIEVTHVDVGGRVYTSLDFDPSYAPEMPVGAVRGDIRAQSYCCTVPNYFYVDKARECVQCGVGFVFRAAEQKYWYEVLKFHLDSTAIRCPACRRQRRSERAVHSELVLARREVTVRPEDPGALLALSAAIVRHYQRSESGRLQDAIAAAREARRVSKGQPGSAAIDLEASFWEASAHACAGRASRARESFERFLTGRLPGRRGAQLTKEAEAWVKERSASGV